MLKQAIIDGFNFQRGYIGLLVDDIPESRMTEMPGKVGTHPAWQLGHIADSVDGAIATLGGRQRFDDAWRAKFAQKSEPTPDPRAYPSKSELLEALDERRETLIETLARTPEAALNKPLDDDRFRAFFGTVGRFVHFLMLSHESMHCGQLATWRKAAGLPQALNNAGRLLEQPAGA